MTGIAALGVPLPLFVDALGQFLRPSTLVGVLVDGLAKSSLYVMIAAGLTLIFGLMGVLNFAHGSLTMLGAYLAGLVLVVTVSSAAGPATRLAYFFLAVVVTFGALSALGATLETQLIRPLYDRPPLSQILLTFGVTLVLDELVRIVVLFYGLQPISDWQAALATKPAPLDASYDLTAPLLAEFGVSGPGGLAVPVSTVDVGAAAVAAVAVALLSRTAPGARRVAALAGRTGATPAAVRRGAAVGAAVAGALLTHAAVAVTGFGPSRAAGLELFEILFGVATVAAVWAFLTRTRYGLVVRAGSEDDEMTEALGIDVRRVFTTVFALGAGIAGVAGALLMWDPVWGASVPLATETLLPAFVVVIIGGLGTFRGTVVAALVVGMTDAAMTWWFQNAIEFTGLPEMTIFLILVIVLAWRPQGLFGVAEVGGH